MGAVLHHSIGRFLAGLGLLLLLGGCAVDSLSLTAAASPASCAAQTLAQPRTIAPADLRVGEGYSTPVISAAQKFIIPVPALGEGGEPLVYPPGHERAGQPIVDYKGNPVGDRGLVFFNGKDRSWQAAVGDGQAVIIINEVSADQAQRLYDTIAALAPDPNQLTLDGLKQAIAVAQNDLGLVDMYNSRRSFVAEHMTPAIAGAVPTVNGNEIAAYGFKKRDDRDINQAIYIPGEFVFQGPAATPQEFANGGVIVEQGGKMRGVQPEIFERTYRLSDGGAIASAPQAIATQCD
jgi:hypothetical protein